MLNAFKARFFLINAKIRTLMYFLMSLTFFEYAKEHNYNDCGMFTIFLR